MHRAPGPKATRRLLVDTKCLIQRLGMRQVATYCDTPDPLYLSWSRGFPATRTCRPTLCYHRKKKVGSCNLQGGYFVVKGAGGQVAGNPLAYTPTGTEQIILILTPRLIQSVTKRTLADKWFESLLAASHPATALRPSTQAIHSATLTHQFSVRRRAPSLTTVNGSRSAQGKCCDLPRQGKSY